LTGINAGPDPARHKQSPDAIDTLEPFRVTELKRA
jgi:hypothetical protein